MVTLNKKSLTENRGNQAADCECDDECRVQCIECGCEGGPEACPCMADPPCDCEDEPSCGCHPHVCVCDSESSSSRLQSKADEKKRQQSKNEKEKFRTFFKIAGSEKDYYPRLPGLTCEYRLKDLEGRKNS